MENQGADECQTQPLLGPTRSRKMAVDFDEALRPLAHGRWRSGLPARSLLNRLPAPER